MRIKTTDTMAMIVDYQERLMPSMAQEEQLSQRATILIKGLKALEIPMIITQQYTKGLGMSVEFVYEAAEKRDYMDKITFSCMDDKEINQSVKDLGRQHVIVCGVEAHICVLQTCLDLKEQGYHPILVADCISSRRTTDRDTALTRAIQEGITITSCESILFELLRKAGGDTFKRISNLVK